MTTKDDLSKSPLRAKAPETVDRLFKQRRAETAAKVQSWLVDLKSQIERTAEKSWSKPSTERDICIDKHLNANGRDPHLAACHILRFLVKSILKATDEETALADPDPDVEALLE